MREKGKYINKGNYITNVCGVYYFLISMIDGSLHRWFYKDGR